RDLPEPVRGRGSGRDRRRRDRSLLKRTGLTRTSEVAAAGGDAAAAARLPSVVWQDRAMASPDDKQGPHTGTGGELHQQVHGSDVALTTNQGLVVADDQNSLKVGMRGPTLLEDFILREKITHFDHERIPERVVHARGYGAHGYFQPYRSFAALTRAGFLQDPARKTPVFVRFSTVAGNKGSADTVRDVRGFA